MKLNGCHNHDPYGNPQILHGMDSLTGEHIVTTIPFRMKEPCQYKLTELGKKDVGCTNCYWKKDESNA